MESRSGDGKAEDGECVYVGTLERFQGQGILLRTEKPKEMPSELRRFRGGSSARLFLLLALTISWVRYCKLAWQRHA